MNIRQAKQYIQDCVRLYLKKDDTGKIRIPLERQRPVFLLGAPGIGKTAIMEQIAKELGIGLVSYSMTHHTRQSALGLPFIRQKEYDGEIVDVTEYTMSEILASVYQQMEETGIRQGILFLDEINCVSETLAPAMLGFLQYKVFGRHRLPEGWVLVTAGNPPLYNRSAREFDVVTLDRLKVLEVEPDYGVFRSYALEEGFHPAVLSFLELERDRFYQVEATAAGRTIITARGWEDLSRMLDLYEEEGLEVLPELVGQYIRSDKAAAAFAAHYEIYLKYRRDMQIEDILAGRAPESLVQQAGSASFDERLALMGILEQTLVGRMKQDVEALQQLSARRLRLQAAASQEEKEQFNRDLTACRSHAQETGAQLSAVLYFADAAFGEGNELLILLTELTVQDSAAAYLARFGSEDYREYAHRLMVTERTDALQRELEELPI